MELTYQLMSRKRREQWRPIYLLYGPEDFLQAEFIRTLKELYIEKEFEDFNFISVDYSANMKDIVDTADSTPFMSDKQIIVIRGAEKMSKSAFARFKNYLNRPSQFTAIIFQTSLEFSKRRKYLLNPDLDQSIKKYGDVILFRAMKKDEAFQYLKEKCEEMNIEIEDKAVDRLIEFVGVDLWRLTTALDKVAMFCLGRTITSRDIKRILIDDAPASIFDLTEAIMNKRQTQALQALTKLMTANEALPMLGSLVRQWRFLRQAKVLESSGLFSGRYDSVEKDKRALPPDLVEQFGDDSLLSQHKFIIFKTIQHSKHFTDEELMRGVCLFYEADRQLKGIRTTAQDGYIVLYELVKQLSYKKKEG